MTRHVAPELQRHDWHGLILHYLGLDHIGHKTGPQGPHMLPKQREMDAVVRTIYTALEEDPGHARTLLVLAGDHGMNAGGNHGGSGPGETEPALVFASPKFRMREGSQRRFEAPTRPKSGTEFHYYEKVQQSDLVPSLAALLGLPVSKNSLGVAIAEVVEGFGTAQDTTGRLRRNARQMLRLVEATYGPEAVSLDVARFGRQRELTGPVCAEAGDERAQIACLWALAVATTADETTAPETAQAALRAFLRETQTTLSGAASSYHLGRMAGGMAVAVLVLGLALGSQPSLLPVTTSSAVTVPRRSATTTRPAPVAGARVTSAGTSRCQRRAPSAIPNRRTRPDRSTTTASSSDTRTGGVDPISGNVVCHRRIPASE